MKVMLAIVKRFLARNLRMKGNLLFIVVMPMAFTWIFSFINFDVTPSTVYLAVVDNDRTTVSAGYIHALETMHGYHVLLSSADQVSTLFRSEQIDMALMLPQGLQKNVLDLHSVTFPLSIMPNAGGAGRTEILQTNVTNQIKAWTVAGSAAEQKLDLTTGHSRGDLAAAFVAGMKNQISSPVQAKTEVLVTDSTQQEHLGNKGVVLGFATLFIFFTVFSLTGTILLEKKDGTWDRLKSSPASKSAVMAGYGLALFLQGWLQYLIMVVSGRYLFHIDVVLNGWMVLIVALYILAISGISLLVAGLSKSQEQHNATGSILAISTSMLGGAYWPIDLEPGWMQHLAWFTPQNWVLNAFKVIAVGGTTMANLFWPGVVLAGFAIIFFIAGMVQLRYS